MYPLYKPFPGSQELIAPNRFSKFDLEHRVPNMLFELISMFTPMGLYMDQNRNKLENRISGRISKNGLAQSIPESLENDNTKST